MCSAYGNWNIGAYIKTKATFSFIKSSYTIKKKKLVQKIIEISCRLANFSYLFHVCTRKLGKLLTKMVTQSWTTELYQDIFFKIQIRMELFELPLNVLKRDLISQLFWFDFDRCYECEYNCNSEKLSFLPGLRLLELFLNGKKL